MTDIDAVREYRERLLDLVVNRSDVRMNGAVQYVPRGKETLEIFDAALAELQAENEALRRQVEALKVCGNCNHWWSGLMGCAMDSSQAVVCEGFDHCKVFTQLADKPETREPCWTDRRRRS